MSQYMVVRTEGKKIVETFPQTGKFDDWNEAVAYAQRRAEAFESATFTIFQAVAEVVAVRVAEIRDVA